ncbi:hypothetical protein ACIPSA_22630 [Streptomyces sp. NPDC086549]|uniref:hypothetical protein n=1 Tax=Streptomyces sp. NPDC086549 TaxID=3365752 RepID=UPI0038037845
MISTLMIRGLTMIGRHGDVDGLTIPGGPWVVSAGPLLDTDGRAVGHTSWYQNCLAKSLDEMPVCLAEGDIHVRVTLQPAERYWSFQWTETGVFAGLAAALASLCFRRVRGRFA